MTIKTHVAWLPEHAGDEGIEYDIDEEIPDEYADRHSILCMKCQWSTYPECRKWCDKG